jgi:uncharacterized protein YggE
MTSYKLFYVVAILIAMACTQNCCDDNTFQISGNAEVSIKPDRATITIQVQDQANTSSAALSLVN